MNTECLAWLTCWVENSKELSGLGSLTETKKLASSRMRQITIFHRSSWIDRARYLLLVCSLSFLGACASSPTLLSTDNARAANSGSEIVAPKGKNESVVVADKDFKNLPKVDLTQELLEQLMIVSFAPYSGDLATSARLAMEAAETSQDYRLASYAALTALRIRDYPLSRQGAELWLDLVEDDAAARTTLIIAQLGVGDIDAAYVLMTEDQGDRSIDEHIKDITSLLVRQRSGQAAVDVVARYVDDFPDSAEVLLSASYVAETFSQDDKAQEWLDQVLILKPNWDEAAQLKAGMLRRQGKVEERANFIADFLERNPHSISMRINHAAELAREEKYQEALALMRAVLEDDPENVPALNYTAALAEHLKEDELAKKLYKKVLRLEPKNDEVYWSLARFAVREKNYQRAEDYYQEISGDELYFRAQLQVANMRYQTLGLKDAINTLRGLEPQTEQEYIDRATTRHYLLMQEHQYEEAFAAINETLVYLPENVDLRYARALVAAELKEIATVEEDLRFVIEKQPDNADALNALGYTLADQTERYEEAKELIAKALELRPEEAHILDSMGWILYRLDDLDGAIKYLQQAYDISPQAEIAAHLGEVLWEKGEQERARVVWGEGLEDDSDSPVLMETMERYGATPQEDEEQQVSLK